MSASPTMSTDFNLGPSLLTACWILAAVAICVVTLRVITRAKTTDHLGADDYMMILSLVSKTLLSSKGKKFLIHIIAVGSNLHGTGYSGREMGSWKASYLPRPRTEVSST